MRWSVLRCIALILWASSLSLSLVAAPPHTPTARPANEKVAAAVLDFDRLPLGPVLEVELAGISDLEWIERSSIDKVLQEQKLQALFSAQGSDARLQLGKLLKADLLIMLRKGQPEDVSPLPTVGPAQDNQESVELVVTETKRGIRLASYTLRPTSNAKADAARIRKVVERALAKQRHGIREIFAVPPFVSEDLEQRYDYLKLAYSKLLEESLLARPGAVVVELAEAQSLVQERALTGDRTTMDRTLPYYFYGEYRNNGSGDLRTVKCGLRLLHGFKEVGNQNLANLKSTEVSRELLKSLAQLLGKLGDEPAATRDANVEASVLAERAAEFEQIGNWHESIALMEASLLLNPDQEELHRRAAIMLARVTSEFRRGIPDRPRTTVAINYYRRALEHLREFLKTAGDLNKYKVTGSTSFMSLFSQAWYGWNYTAQAPADVQEMIRNFEEEQRQIMRQIARERAPRVGDDLIFALWSVRGLSAQQTYDVLYDMLLEFRSLPRTKYRAWSYAKRGYSSGILETPEAQAFLNKIAALPEPEIQTAVLELRRDLKDDQERRAREQAALKNLPAPEPVDHHFKLANPAWTDIEGKPLQYPVMFGCVPAGDGCDLFYRGSELYLMKKRDKFKQLPNRQSPNSWLSSVFFDGKYVWMAYDRHNDSPLLLAIDPIAERIHRLGVEQGMPDDPLAAKSAQRRVLRAAPLGPGKVCVAGSFGRLWVGVFSLDDDGAASFRLIHEGRIVANPEDKENWKDPRVACTPSLMYTLTEKSASSTPGQRVLIGRENSGSVDVTSHPLLIDPQSGKAEVMEEYLWGSNDPAKLDARHGSVFGIFPVPALKRLESRLYEVEYPGRLRVTKELHVPDGLVAFDQGRFHIFGRKHWTVDLDSDTISLRSEVPWSSFADWSPTPQVTPGGKPSLIPGRLLGVSHSNHYGLMLTVREDIGVKNWIVPSSTAK